VNALRGDVAPGERSARARDGAGPARTAPAGHAGPHVTAREAGLVRCHACGLLARVRRLATRTGLHCPRCAAPLRQRKPDVAARTWCFLVAAAILYVPANALPVMRIVSFGSAEEDTILGGVKALFATGQPAIALVVLFASITVPLLKIGGLAWLLLSAQRGWTWRRRDRTRLHRLIEIVGRWSMLDIFMLSILAGLVKLDAIATVEAGPGALAFAAVVVLTLCATASFDPRLIWDSLREDVP